jgi:hypothetical protein
MKRISQFLALILIGNLVVSPLALAADYYQTRRRSKPDSNVMAADALIGRPVGLAATVLGTTTFVATLPFTAFSGSVRDAARGLIKEPGAWTFTRPLGEPPANRHNFIIR